MECEIFIYLDNILGKLGLWCAEVFPLLFLATAMLHRCLSFLKQDVPHLDLSRIDDAKCLGNVCLWVLMKMQTELYQPKAPMCWCKRTDGEWHN